ncbi:MAG: methyltransferase domain-containing protein [Planctomycetota bacterium]
MNPRSCPHDPRENGWERSAAAWITEQGERGDFGRREVLDPVMLPWALRGAPGRVLDVGCGEGRFCRLLQSHGIRAIGIDPTAKLLARARALDPPGTYVEGRAEELPFDDSTFDLVVSYLSLIDIPRLEPAITEMVRVLRPRGRLLIANLTSFTTARRDGGLWRRAFGWLLGAPVARYLEEHARWIDYRGIRVLNHHRPLATYMRLLLAAGLELVDFDEPPPREGAPELRAARYRRAPWFVVMEWRKATGDGGNGESADTVGDRVEFVP